MAIVRKEAVLILPLFYGVAVATFFNLPFIGGQFSGVVGGVWSGGQGNLINPPSEKVQRGEDDYATDYRGSWELASASSGISAMHSVLMPTNKVIMLDAANFGPSKIGLPPGNCKPLPNGTSDCWAHSVEYDIDTGHLRPLRVLSNTWCSSGALDSNGTLVQTGGWKDGGRGLRFLDPCTTCTWEEYQALAGPRWYSTQHILPDGRFIVLGGRRQFSYEFVPSRGSSNGQNAAIRLPFLRRTTDESENNLYPFMTVNTDGNVFIFANNRSILLDYTANKVIRTYPELPGGSRNYPSSGGIALLPLRLRGNPERIAVEVLVCGGTLSHSAVLAARNDFLPALTSCGRLDINRPDAVWRLEDMPTPRVMGDMLLLPTADVLVINGAKRGSAGWGFSRDPNFEPLVYKPNNNRANRFFPMNPSTIPRLYHSSCAVLPDGRILVAGSNPNQGYNFTAEFPTELRVEKFWPSYLDPLLAAHRPAIVGDTAREITYGEKLTLSVSLSDTDLNRNNAKVTMYLPPFTTHGTSMNQRMLILSVRKVEPVGRAMYELTCLAPSNSNIAPPGYYLLFVVNRGVPSKGVWVRIH